MSARQVPRPPSSQLNQHAHHAAVPTQYTLPMRCARQRVPLHAAVCCAPLLCSALSALLPCAVTVLTAAALEPSGARYCHAHRVAPLAAWLTMHSKRAHVQMPSPGCSPFLALGPIISSSWLVPLRQACKLPHHTTATLPLRAATRHGICYRSMAPCQMHRDETAPRCSVRNMSLDTTTRCLWLSHSTRSWLRIGMPAEMRESYPGQQDMVD